MGDGSLEGLPFSCFGGMEGLREGYVAAVLELRVKLLPFLDWRPRWAVPAASF